MAGFLLIMIDMHNPNVLTYIHYSFNKCFISPLMETGNWTATKRLHVSKIRFYGEKKNVWKPHTAHHTPWTDVNANGNNSME